MLCKSYCLGVEIEMFYCKRQSWSTWPNSWPLTESSRASTEWRILNIPETCAAMDTHCIVFKPHLVYIYIYATRKTSVFCFKLVPCSLALYEIHEYFLFSFECLTSNKWSVWKSWSNCFSCVYWNNGNGIGELWLIFVSVGDSLVRVCKQNLPTIKNRFSLLKYFSTSAVIRRQQNKQ